MLSYHMTCDIMNATSEASLTCLDLYENETDPYYPTLKLPTHMVVIYAIVYSFIFLSAVIGNVMVVVVVVRTPRMHTVTNIFITNLAVADILVAIFCIPITFLDNIYSGWPFTAFLCKMTPYIQGVCVCATVYNLAAIAIDRFIAICFHPRWRIMKRTGAVILCLIWIFSLLVQIPWAVYYQQLTKVTTSQTIYMCSPLWPDFDSQRVFFVVVIFIGTYLLPLSVVLLCYIMIAWRVWHRRAPGLVVGRVMMQRCRKNVIKMLITVVLMFALSWLPLHVLFLVQYFDPPCDKEVLQRIDDIGVPLAQVLELSNSGMNAFIYSFFSGNFRNGFSHIVYGFPHERTPIRGNSTSQRTTRSASEDFITSTKRTSAHRPNSTRQTNKRQNVNQTSCHTNTRTHFKNILQTSLAYSPSLFSENDSAYV